MGVKISKVHNMYKFTQHSFLLDFIQKNIEKRKNAKTEQESSGYKLLSNSLFGKFLCNSVNYSNQLGIYTCKKTVLPKLMSDLFVSVHLIRHNKVAIVSKKSTIALSFPNFLGFSILEITRLINYRLYYNVLLPIFKNNNLKLLYSDTDSWIIKYTMYFEKNISLSEQDFFNYRNNLLKKLKNYNSFDTSNYNKDHDLYDYSTKGTLGILKNEFPKSFINIWIGLAPKCYFMNIHPYHTSKIINLISIYLETIYKSYNILKCYYKSLDCIIVEIFNDEESISNILNTICETKIMLENYHNVILCIEMDDYPVSACFYDNTIYSEHILTECKNKSNLYFLELSKDLNISIFKYYVDDDFRPIPDKMIMSEAELLCLKSKTCAGIPYHLSMNLSLSDYRKALCVKRDQLTKISYKSIKYLHTDLITDVRSRSGMKALDVKRYYINESKSFSYGHYLTGQSSNFSSFSETSENESLLSDSQISLYYSSPSPQSNDGDSSSSHDIPTNIFLNRIKKYNRLTINNPISNPNNSKNISKSISTITKNIYIYIYI